MTRFQTIGADEMERNQMMVIGIAAVILVAAVGVTLKYCIETFFYVFICKCNHTFNFLTE